MLKSCRQPGTTKIPWIQRLWLVRTIGEFDGGEIVPRCPPGNQRSGIDRATAYTIAQLTLSAFLFHISDEVCPVAWRQIG